MPTYRQKYDTVFKWDHKVIVMYLYHMKYPRARLKDVAKYFDVSIGLVSENLKLGKQLKTLKKYPSRRIALNHVK